MLRKPKSVKIVAWERKETIDKISLSILQHQKNYKENTIMNKNIINISPLISTRNFLNEIISKANNDYEKAGAIQAFEVCYELAKNTIRKVLLLRAQEVHITPKEIFRLAGLEGLIDNAEVWFEFAKKRNKTSHTYDGEVASEILNSLPNFLNRLDLLIAKLKKLPECSN